MEFSRKRCIFWVFLAAALSLQCGGTESTNGKAEPADNKAEPADNKAETADNETEAEGVKGEPGDVKAEAQDNKVEPASAEAEIAPRNADWAKPVEKPGLPNLHEVAPGIYRGAQPEVEGFRSLKAMGVKTIVNLRNFHSDKDEIEEAGLKGAFEIVELEMNAHSVKEEDIISFLKVATDKTKHPLFFHCQHGADRTGTMAAAYRIVVQGWTKEDAIKEMQDGGFNYHSIWRNLPKLLEGLDVEKVKKAL